MYKVALQRVASLLLVLCMMSTLTSCKTAIADSNDNSKPTLLWSFSLSDGALIDGSTLFT